MLFEECAPGERHTYDCSIYCFRPAAAVNAACQEDGQLLRDIPFLDSGVISRYR